MTHKETLEFFIKNYNQQAHPKKMLVLNETDKYIGLELGGHWITKNLVSNPSDEDYGKLHFWFFRFLCNMACDNIPTYKELEQ